MDTNNEYQEIGDTLDAQRDIIRRSLNTIANDIGMALRDAGLDLASFVDFKQSIARTHNCAGERPRRSHVIS